ncbi:hypothetical protein BDQ12DRAFT_679408 [Crucibulum laeve]|uniref:Uncharacterized protein n=1 Tax=Crucibulum laeve TaxID=68775 RepID=A0A5C3M9L0_9AGAR|nr:hypothetical protein BDQ12DRAFT_679408 [Crucibulum laeve]
MFNFRRKEVPWEVVESKAVDPVPMYYDDEELDIVAVGEDDIRKSLVFDIKHVPRTNDVRNAVVFARDQLMQGVVKAGYSTLLLESWRVTTHRQHKRYRIEVEYSGRPVRALGKLPSRRPPPFMAILQSSW